MLTKLHPPDTTRKTTIVLPSAVIDRLNQDVPARQRSRFIAEAVIEKLELLEQAQGIEEGFGLWTDEEYPHLKDDAAIDQWLADLRKGWNRGNLFDGNSNPT